MALLEPSFFTGENDMKKLKKLSYAQALISAILVTLVLLYIMMKTPSPKIIFVPFLICGIAFAGRSAALLLDREGLAALFRKLFIAGFLLFWFGALILAGYIIIRDRQFTTAIFLLPFLLAGIGYLRKLF